MSVSSPMTTERLKEIQSILMADKKIWTQEDDDLLYELLDECERRREGVI